MIIRIFLFLRDEYNFIKLHNIDNCKLGPLHAVQWRTAQATGLSAKYISSLLKPYRNCPPLALTSSQAEDTEVNIKDNIAQTDMTIHTNKECSNQSSDEETASNNEVIVLDIKPEAKDIEDESSNDFHQETLVVNQNQDLISVYNVSGIKEEKPDTHEYTQGSEEEILGLVQTIPGFQPETSFTEQKLEVEHEMQVNQLDSQKNLISLNNVRDIKEEFVVELDDFKYEIPIMQQEALITQNDTLDFSQEIPGAPNEETDFENEIEANILECFTNKFQDTSDDEKLLTEVKRKRV